MVASFSFFRARISSRRSSRGEVRVAVMAGGPCFLCGVGTTHIRRFRDGLASSLSYCTRERPEDYLALECTSCWTPRGGHAAEGPGADHVVPRGGRRGGRTHPAM